MPIYEYKCNNCGRINEFLEGVNQDRIEKICRYCNSRDLIKIFSRSFVSTGGDTVDSQAGVTCCGRDKRCESPPCSDDGICKR